MVAELTPGTEAAGRLEEGGTIPISQTLPDVNLDEILSSLDTDTRDYLLLLLNDGAQGLGFGAEGPRAGAAIRRLEPTAKYAREINEGLAERRENLKRVVHNFSLLTDRARQARHAAGELRPELQRGVRDAGRPGRVAAADPAEAAGDAEHDADHAGQGQDAGRRARADARGAAAGGAGAGAVAAADAAVPGAVDADPARRDPPVHARGAADGAGAAPGDARPRGDHAGPDAPPSASSTACSTRPPTTRRARRTRATCSGSRGSTTPATRCSPPPTRTVRSGAAWSCSRAATAQLLGPVAEANPTLGTIIGLLNSPTSASDLPELDAGAGRRLSHGQGRSRPRQDRGDGAVRAVVLRAAAVPVARVRRPGAAEAEGLPLPHVLRRGRPARARGRRADLRRAGRQGQDDHAGQGDRALRRRDPAAVALRAAAVGREGDPAPEDAAGRDLRRAHAGPRTLAERSPRAGRCRRRRSRTRSSSTRSCARSTPRRAPPSRTGCRRRRRRSAGAGRTSTTRSATSRRSPRTRRRSSTSSTARKSAVSRLIANTGIVFEALSERDGQLRSLIENSNTVFATTAARDDELQGLLPGAADVRGRVAQDVRPPDRVLRDDRPADHAAAARGARALADARGPGRHLARSQEPARAAAAADRRVQDGLPGGRAGARGHAPAARAARARDRAADARGRLHRALQARPGLVLRQLGRRDAGQGRGHVSCTTCAPRTRSTSRTSPSIRAGCRPTARTRTGCRTGSTRSTRAWPSTRIASARRRT